MNSRIQSTDISLKLDDENDLRQWFETQSMVHLKTENKLLFMGGKLKRIMIWNIDKDEWQCIKDVTLSGNRSRGGIVVTRDDKYVIFFGGGGSWIKDSNTIQIFDVVNEKMYQCNIQCPHSGEYRAVLIDNFEKSDIIIDGYLRMIWKEYEFIGMNELPVELIKLLRRFYAQEWLHLMAIRTGEHWKIELPHLLESISTVPYSCSQFSYIFLKC